MTIASSKLLAELSSQHDALRAAMKHCEDLADELDLGRGDPLVLTREVAALRLAFESHNRFEEQWLRPLLRELAADGVVRIDQVFAAHVDEHRAMGAQLGSEITNTLRATIDDLRQHLEAEERTFWRERCSTTDHEVREDPGRR